MARISNSSKLRGLSLLDACVFIGATALGLAVIRSDEMKITRSWWDMLPSSPLGAFRLRFSLVVVYTSPFLFFYSVAIVALALRSCRGDRKEAMRQPGVAACIIVVVSTILFVVINPVRKFLYGTLYAYDKVGQSLDGVFVQGLLDMASRAGYFVTALWTIQALAGAGKGPSSWADKVGRAIGVIWISLLFSPPLKLAF